MEIEDIERMNDLAADDGTVTIDSSFQFVVGMEIGLMDPIVMDKNSVEWYTLQFIEPDDELNIAFLYLIPNDLQHTKAEDLHEKAVVINSQPVIIQYTEILDSINSSGRMVLPQ